jgi:glutamate synthase (NADPH/NADH) small chain
MSETLLKFHRIPYGPPEARPAPERVEDFHEIYREYLTAKAEQQASRCSQCGIPFCASGCPLGNNIPDWLQLTAEGRLKEAYDAAAHTNPMPEVCGRICPQDKLCEGNCVVERAGFGTVTIGAVERWITDNAFNEGWVPPIPVGPARPESIGIVGAGPAGMAAAEALRQQGFSVTLYDRYDRVGGLMIYGIPNFKLDKSHVLRRTERLQEAGVVFRMSWELGRDGDLESLRKEHDAVLLAFGAYDARRLDAPGAEAAETVAALDYLTVSNRTGLGETVEAFESGLMNAAGKRVVVVGGGDTAMDCVRTAIRQDAARVVCLYRRDRENMPGSAREVKSAEAEGVEFEWLALPESLNKAEGFYEIGVARMRLGAPGPDGRRQPEKIPDAAELLQADLLIEALGFTPHNAAKLGGAEELQINRWGAVTVDGATQMTSVPGVFAAGDLARGASLVVWALRDALAAARGITAWLDAQAKAAA